MIHYKNGDQFLRDLTLEALWRAYALRFMTVMDWDILDNQLAARQNNWN